MVQLIIKLTFILLLYKMFESFHPFKYSVCSYFGCVFFFFNILPSILYNGIHVIRPLFLLPISRATLVTLIFFLPYRSFYPQIVFVLNIGEGTPKPYTWSLVIWFWCHKNYYAHRFQNTIIIIMHCYCVDYYC